MTKHPAIGDTRIDPISGETWEYIAFDLPPKIKALHRRKGWPLGRWLPIPHVTSSYPDEATITESELAMIAATTPVESPEAIAAAIAAVPKFDEEGYRLDENGSRTLTTKVA